MKRLKRWLLIGGLTLAVAGAAGWYWQSQLIGLGTRWYLARVAAAEEAKGDLTQRRATVQRVSRMLLMLPPPDAFVPELFDLLTAVSSRVATGEIDLNWAGYVFNSYERDMARDRPNGTPRRSHDEIEAVVAEYVRFYSLQKRPDQEGYGLRSLRGEDTGDSISVEEIERAHKEGRDPLQPTPSS